MVPKMIFKEKQYPEIDNKIIVLPLWVIKFYLLKLEWSEHYFTLWKCICGPYKTIDGLK
jgi:hypothetical protein